MILVILAISIAMLLCGLYLQSTSRCSSLAEDVGEVLTGVFGVATAAAVIAIIVLMISVTNNSTIDERIAMYTEENQRIEEQIDILVKDYQEYERGIYADTKTESAITLVALYPELKADKLVESQLDIYIKNNEMIKSLKTSQINADVLRWWLYFGGK